MKKDKSICEKLAMVDELFPAERIDRSKERWTRLWTGQAPLDRIPFMLSATEFTAYKANLSGEETLTSALNEAIRHGRAGDDFIPQSSTGCHHGTIPSMFGAKERMTGDDFDSEKLLSSIEEAKGMVAGSIRPGTLTTHWLDLQKWLLEASDGRIPIRVVDMQGPFDVAAKLLGGYEPLFLGAYDTPEFLHLLMEKTTDAFILFWNAQATLLAEHFVGTHFAFNSWVPPGNGASVSVDSLVMYGPEFYTEFIQPYLEKISETFGGLEIHSCGNFAKMMPDLVCTKGLKGINASQMSLKELSDSGLTREIVAVINASFGEQSSVKIPFGKLQETAELISEKNLRAELTVYGVWPESDTRAPDEWTSGEWMEIRNKTDAILALMLETARKMK